MEDSPRGASAAQQTHTPGPWLHRRAGKVTVDTASGPVTEDYPDHVVAVRHDEKGRRKCTGFVAVCHTTTLPDAANACLIAAAPELLDACRMALVSLKQGSKLGVTILERAIAKAEGRK